MNEQIKLWEDRIKEVSKTGNCKNSLGQPYFSEKHTKDEKLFFCDSMINKLKSKQK